MFCVFRPPPKLIDLGIILAPKSISNGQKKTNTKKRRAHTQNKRTIRHRGSQQMVIPRSWKDVWKLTLERALCCL